jgi:hypothetical protein
MTGITYNLTESNKANVLERLSNRMYDARTTFLENCDYTEPVDASAYTEVYEFYAKRLSDRRKEFNRKSSTRNLCLLQKATLAYNTLNEKLDLIRISDYHENKYA